jgi:hypothetical protein
MVAGAAVVGKFLVFLIVGTDGRWMDLLNLRVVAFLCMN